MAEPFAVIATIAGLAAVALHSARKTKELIDSVVDAPNIVADIANNVKLLEAVLVAIGTLLAEYQRTSSDARVLDFLRMMDPPLQKCTITLNELKVLIGRCVRHRGRGGRSWHRGTLRWKFTEKKIRSHLRTLETFKASLQLALAAFALVIESSSARIIRAEIHELRGFMVVQASRARIHVPSRSRLISSSGVSITSEGIPIQTDLLESQPQRLISPPNLQRDRAPTCVDDEETLETPSARASAPPRAHAQLKRRREVCVDDDKPSEIRSENMDALYKAHAQFKRRRMTFVAGDKYSKIRREYTDGLRQFMHRRMTVVAGNEYPKVRREDIDALRQFLRHRRTSVHDYEYSELWSENANASYSGAADNERLNRMLTLISVVFIPLSFVSALFGMNFEVLRA